MTGNVAVLDPAATPAPTITPDQLALIRTTIAKGATDDELRLFLFDCARQGVHPLDKLIHFTKRSGRYTPITSIDFMRIRAAQTGDCAGIDDAVFAGDPKTPSFAASVTVWRIVQGQRCAFTATARWNEYKPDQDFMWQKMPHGQLGKCAEALALRRGFPQELADLHTFEELDHDREAQPSTKRVVQRASEKAVGGAVVAGPAVAGDQVTAFRTVKEVRSFGKNQANFAVVLDGDPTEYTTKDGKLAAELGQFKGTDHKVYVSFRRVGGEYILDSFRIAD